MTSSVDVSVVIISHGHEDMLAACVGSLKTALEGLIAEIILIDNLGGGRPEWADESFPIFWHANRQPIGFAANVNLGFAGASGRYYLILNPDTVHARGSLTVALALLETRAEVGIVGCTLLNEDGSHQQSYRQFPTFAVFLARGLAVDKWPWRPQFYHRRMMADQTFASAQRVDWVFGAFMLLRRRDFAQLGGMDEGFRLYYEDVDLCWRAREIGLETWVLPEIAFTHAHRRESATAPFGKTWRWHGQSAVRFFWRTRRRARRAPPSAPGLDSRGDLQ